MTAIFIVEDSRCGLRRSLEVVKGIQRTIAGDRMVDDAETHAMRGTITGDAIARSGGSPRTLAPWA